MSNALKVSLDMRGGAMGRMAKARVKGKELNINDPVDKHKMIWAFNGDAGMPEKPLFTAKRGQTVELTMINNTAWPHAMHIHGIICRKPQEKAERPTTPSILLSILMPCQ